MKPDTMAYMTDVYVEEELPPTAHVTITFLGPVAPHWELQRHFGDEKFLDDFWARVNARLLLIPKHDPQFRRNRERVNRDAERERIVCAWDLGEDDEETVLIEPGSVLSPSEESVEEVSEQTEESELSEPEEVSEIVEEESVEMSDAVEETETEESLQEES